MEFKRNRKRAWRLDTDNRPREAKQLKEDSWYTGDSDIESGGGYSYDQKVAANFITDIDPYTFHWKWLFPVFATGW